MTDTPDIDYLDFESYFLDFDLLDMIFSSEYSNKFLLKHVRELFLKKGIICYANTWSGLSSSLSYINLEPDFVNELFQLIEKKDMFELEIMDLIIKNRTFNVYDVNAILNNFNYIVLDNKKSVKLISSAKDRLNFIHVRFSYINSIVFGRMPVKSNFIGYVLILVNQENLDTILNIYIIVKHKSDFTITKKAVHRVFYDSDLTIEEKFFEVPIEERVKISGEFFRQLESNNIEIIGVIDSKSKRIGARDSSHETSFRSRQLTAKHYDFEDYESVFNEISQKRRELAFLTIAILINQQFPGIIIIVTINYINRVTIKINNSYEYTGDLDENIFDQTLSRHSFEKLLHLPKVDLSDTKKFYICEKLFSHLKPLLKNNE